MTVKREEGRETEKKGERESREGKATVTPTKEAGGEIAPTEAHL